MENETVKLNGKEMTVKEFETEKKRLSEKKIQIIETSKNTFITRMLD